MKALFLALLICLSQAIHERSQSVVVPDKGWFPVNAAILKGIDFPNAAGDRGTFTCRSLRDAYKVLTLNAPAGSSFFVAYGPRENICWLKDLRSSGNAVSNAGRYSLIPSMTTRSSIDPDLNYDMNARGGLGNFWARIDNRDFPNGAGNVKVIQGVTDDSAYEVALAECGDKPSTGNIICIYGRDAKTIWVKDLLKSGSLIDRSSTYAVYIFTNQYNAVFDEIMSS